MPQFKNIYGVNWPDKASPVDIELALYRHNAKYRKWSNGVFPAEEHFINAVRMLFTDKQLTWNRWTEAHALSFVRDDFAMIWGPGAASKSNDYGAFCVVDWWADPLNTYTAICSTTAPMLEKRIWEAVQRYHGYHAHDCPGIHMASKFAILASKDESKEGTRKAGIHGFAVLAGTNAQTEANIVGVHLPRVRLIVDEMQSTRRAAVDARNNLEKGASDSFKFFGLCNPDSFLNIAGEYSEPLAGWDSISDETEEWETKEGKCYHFDGLKSPAVVEENGAEKYPYLINQEQIDKAKKRGEDSPHYWIYVRGFPPPSGVTNTVMNEAECRHWHIFDDVIWRDTDRLRMATLDPAYGGDDDCRLKIWEAGYAVNGSYTVENIENFTIPVKAGAELPPMYQIAVAVKQYGELFGFKPTHLAVDESVTQGCGEVISQTWGKGVHRIDFNARPLMGLLSVDSNIRCEDEYYNMISSLYGQFHDYCKYGQIRGLNKEAARQLCSRIVLEGMPYQIEPKKLYKKRMGKSPDDADCCAMLSYLLRYVISVIPGALASVGSSASISGHVAQYFDVDASDDVYLHSGL